MVRMKLTDEEFNPKKLDVEVEGRRFERYDGEIPRTGTILEIRVTKMWWTNADDGTSMIKLIAVAENNNGRLKEFNGLPTWEYLTFKPSAAFRYQPFLQCFEIPLRDIRSKLDVEADDDNIGTPINSIGDWVVGSDDAVARIVVKRDRYDGEWRSKVDVDGWLPLEDDVEVVPDDDDDEPEEDTRPPRRGRSTPAPARGGRAASGRSRDVPDDDDDDDDEDDYDVEDETEDEDEEAEEEDQEEAATPPRRGGRTRAATSSRARPARTSPAAGPRDSRRASADDGGRRSSGGSSRTPSRRGSNKGSKDDPPF